MQTKKRSTANTFGRCKVTNREILHSGHRGIKSLILSPLPTLPIHVNANEERHHALRLGGSPQQRIVSFLLGNARSTGRHAGKAF